MRHKRRGRKLNRDTDHRKALGRNLINSLFTHEKIVTTPAKAKEFRPAAEKLITMARKAHKVMQDAGSDEAARKAAEVKKLHYVRMAIQQIGKIGLKDRDGDWVLTSNDRVRTVIQKLFEDLGPRFATRPGGYTRILRLPTNRLGDNAPQVIWELMPEGNVGAEA